ncbi:putative periplasmic binding protein-like I [Helianthus anomalus]
MKAVTAILHSWSISQVTLTYKSSHLASGSAAIISYLSQALRQTRTLTHILTLTFGSHSVSAELEILKRQQSKVFVIYTSLELAVSLIQTANKMEVNGDGYLWIATRYELEEIRWWWWFGEDEEGGGVGPTRYLTILFIMGWTEMTKLPSCAKHIGCFN